MRTYKLTIAYDGTAYQGWQRQANKYREHFAGNSGANNFVSGRISSGD